MSNVSQVDPIPPTTPFFAEADVTKIEEYRRRIRSSWKKTVEDFLELGAVCRDAADHLSKSEVETLLLSDMPINESTFWKFVTIGRDERLPGIAGSLPPKFTTIYEVSQLTDEQFEQAVASQKIHPKVRREDIAALRKRSDSGGGPENGAKASHVEPESERLEDEAIAPVQERPDAPEGEDESPPTAPEMASDPLELPAALRRADADETYERVKSGWRQHYQSDFLTLPKAKQIEFVIEVLGISVLTAGTGDGDC
jgi:hypothetical protein